MLRRAWRSALLVAVLLAGTAVALLLVPGLRDRAAYAWDALRIEWKYRFDPPQSAVFLPAQGQDAVAAAVQSTLQALTPSPLPSPSPSAAPPLGALPTPTATPLPLPPRTVLEGVRYQSQRYLMNYCAPANLAMALSFWGWEGDRATTGAWLKPFGEDKNVMPYEMMEYARQETRLSGLVRPAGTLDVLRSLLAAGFPVLVEKGEVLHGEYGPGSTGWMGHYLLFTGYDDTAGSLISQDSLVGADQSYPYSRLEEDWRAFNYVFLVFYPPELESEVLAALGPLADETASYQAAALRAANEVMGLDNRDRFFALLNRGSSLVELQDYGGAALVFDEAFAFYPSIPEADRPYRALWYNTSPYKAYFYTQRYWDVIALATTTLDAMTEATLEESFYWRARAEWMLGDSSGALRDVKQALKYHAGFQAALELQAEMGY